MGRFDIRLSDISKGLSLHIMKSTSIVPLLRHFYRLTGNPQKIVTGLCDVGSLNVGGRVPKVGSLTSRRGDEVIPNAYIPTYI